MLIEPGKIFKSKAPMKIEPVMSMDGNCLDEVWTVFNPDHGNEADDFGTFIIEVNEVLPSETGQPVVVYKQYFTDPDGLDVGTVRRRKITRTGSLVRKISTYGMVAE
jgi:hypothetical protein